MKLKAWLERQAPDILQTWQRFPLAIVLAALSTAIALGAINDQSWLQRDEWARAALGLATGAVLAIAGVYFAESRPEAKGWGVVLKYVLPLAAVGLFEITDVAWFVPYALPVISILWLSLSPFTPIGRGEEREAQQNRFWVVNHQALATAALAGGAFGILALGFLVIERSLSILFGIESATLFYRWLLPFTGLFLTPVYWLSTLPRLSEVDAGEAERPGFIGRATGFLGQFVLVPMLFLYALILLAYTAQIVVTQKLPQGTIGWMVMGFVVVGAGTWLVLHPPFMRGKPLVRLFRRLWFWLTLVPLGLFFFAVWVRVDAYGLTAERMLLAAGGVWALALAAIFLTRRGDIRVVPGLAGLLLLVLSIGPWNYTYLPLQQQLAKLDAVVMNAGADKSLSPPRPNWSREDVTRAHDVIDFLSQSREGRQGTRDLMAKYGVTWAADADGSHAVLAALGVSAPPVHDESRFVGLMRDFERQPVDVSKTPYLLRPVAIYGEAMVSAYPLHFEMKGGVLFVRKDEPGAEATVQLDLRRWMEETRALPQPWFDFAVGEVNYRLVVNSLSFDRGAAPRVFSSVDGLLFADQPPTPTP